MEKLLMFNVDEAFRCIIQNVPLKVLFKKKPKFEVYIRIALCLSTLKPSMSEKIGTFWIDDYTFAFKTKNFACLIGLKINTVNFNLRSHQFEEVGKVSPEYIKNFDDKDNWKIMQDKQNLFTRFNVNNGNQELLQYVNPKKHVKKQESDQIDALPFIQENNYSSCGEYNAEIDFEEAVNYSLFTNYF